MGPLTVERMLSSTSSPPATFSVSVRSSRGTRTPSRQYRSPSIFSRYRSVTSVVRFVNPHAMRLLCPMITPGTPEKPKPDTSNVHASVTTPHLRPT